MNSDQLLWGETLRHVDHSSGMTDTYGYRSSATLGDQSMPLLHRHNTVLIELIDEPNERVISFVNRLPDLPLHAKGRTQDPHVTVLCGLGPAELDQVVKVVQKFEPFDITFGSTSLFRADDQNKPEAVPHAGMTSDEAARYDVLKCDVASAKLRNMNEALRAAFVTADRYPTYKPHVTLAYLTPGFGNKYVGMSPLAGVTFKVRWVTYVDQYGNRQTISLRGAESEPAPSPAYQMSRRDDIHDAEMDHSGSLDSLTRQPGDLYGAKTTAIPGHVTHVSTAFEAPSHVHPAAFHYAMAQHHKAAAAKHRSIGGRHGEHQAGFHDRLASYHESMHAHQQQIPGYDRPLRGYDNYES